MSTELGWQVQPWSLEPGGPPSGAVLTRGLCTASWSNPEPPNWSGQARLRGHLFNLSHGLGPAVQACTGLVLRVQVMSHRFSQASPDQAWRTVPESLQLRDVQQSPKWFRRAHREPPGFDETGVLVDLELSQPN